MAAPTLTLGGKTVWSIPGDPAVNYFYSRTGASNYGYGFFMLTRADFMALLGGSTNTVILEMTGSYGPGLTQDVVLAGAEPYATTTGDVRSNGSTESSAGNLPTDLMRVKVIDQRCFMDTPVDLSFNVASQGTSDTPFSTGFSWDSTHSIINCYPSTLKSTNTPWTWAQIFDAVSSAYTSTPAQPSNMATWTPYNLIYDQVNGCLATDDIANRLYYIVGYNAPTNGLTLNVPGVMTSDNTTMYGRAMSQALNAGGIGARNPGRLPAIFSVNFRCFNVDNVDPYAGTRTVKFSETVNASGSATQPLACGEAIAIEQGGAIVNNTQLQAIADDIAPRKYTMLSVVPEQREFLGIWPFAPDGAIRSVLWVSNDRIQKTVIRLNNDQDANPQSDFRRTMDQLSSRLTVGLGASQVSVDAGSKTQQVWGAFGGKNVVLCTIDSNGTVPGTYSGFFWVPPTSDVPAGSTLVKSDFGTTGTACLIENASEVGATGPG